MSAAAVGAATALSASTAALNAITAGNASRTMIHAQQQALPGKPADPVLAGWILLQVVLLLAMAAIAIRGLWQ